jgi:hypothetical protein
MSHQLEKTGQRENPLEGRQGISENRKKSQLWKEQDANGLVERREEVPILVILGRCPSPLLLSGWSSFLPQQTGFCYMGLGWNPGLTHA